MTNPAPERRWRPRWTLQGLVILIVVVGGPCGWMIGQTRAQRNAVAAIREAGGVVFYAWEMNGANPYPFQVEHPWAPRLLVRWLGPDLFGDVVYVNLIGCHETPGLLKRVSTLTTVRYLNLFTCEWIEDSSLASLSGLSRLEQLDLSATSVRGPGLIHLWALPNLRVLELRGVLPERFEIRWLQGLRRLESLSLTMQEFKDDDLADLRGLPKLTRLELSGSSLTDQGLDQLADLPSLQTVILDDCLLITDVGVSGLVRFPQCTTISALNTQVSHEAAQDIQKAYPRVEVLLFEE